MGPSRLFSCTLWINGAWLAISSLCWYNLCRLRCVCVCVSKPSLGAEDLLRDSKRLGNLLGPLPIPPCPQLPLLSDKSGLAWIVFFLPVTLHSQ